MLALHGRSMRLFYALMVLFGARYSEPFYDCWGVSDGTQVLFCDDAEMSAGCQDGGEDTGACACLGAVACSCPSSSRFNCSDLSHTGLLPNCRDEPLLIEPCSPGVSSSWVVNDTASAVTLAEAVGCCSGGVFEVEWRGRVTVNRTILISGGTVLHVFGVGSSPVMDGGTSTQVIAAVNVTLRVENLQITGGYAVHGGAVAVVTSDVRFTNVSFVANAATGHGGAVFASRRSIVYFDGPASFVENTAISCGGALHVNDGSSVLWSGDTYFYGNVARSAGGALGVENSSSAHWSSAMTFSENNASLGGAVYVSGTSQVSWDGKTDFSGNFANWTGGGVFVSSSSNVSWTIETSFAWNTARDDGGAVSVYGGNDALHSSSLSIVAKSTFVGNTCGGQGGGLAITGASTLSMDTDDLTLEKNSAAGAGGAVFISGLSFGPHFVGARFLSNAGSFGGAVSITSSGLGTTAHEGIGFEQWSPTIFDECEFVDNWASERGGALDLWMGSNVFNSVHFGNNTAKLGGALSTFAGTVYLDGCEFVENTSDEDGGPAVYCLEADAVNLSNSSFLKSGFNCPEGYFRDYYMTLEVEHVLAAFCRGCKTTCEDCSIPENALFCSEGPEFADSPGGDTTVETLQIHPGYWRSSSTSYDVRECYNPDACPGGLTGGEYICTTGYEGELCSVCIDGYTASSEYTCARCTDEMAGLVTAVFFIVISAIVLIILVLYMVSDEKPVESGVADRRVSSYLQIRYQSLKIVLVTLQLLAQTASAVNVVFPGVYNRLLNGMNVLSFDLGWMLSAGCIMNLNFHHRLLISTLLPLATLALLGVTYAIGRMRNQGDESALRKVQDKHISVVILSTFIIYSPVSSILCQMFLCYELDNGQSLLVADFQISCTDPKHLALQLYAMFMFLPYTVGIPVFYALLLFRNRELLSDSAAREDDSDTRSISTLWRLYKPSCYYFELIECLRRFCLSGLLVFLYWGTAAQACIVLLMTMLFLVLSEVLDPYDSKLDSWISRMGQVAICTSMIWALMLKADEGGGEGKSRYVYTWTIMCEVVGMFSVVAIEIVSAVRDELEEMRLKEEQA